MLILALACGRAPAPPPAPEPVAAPSPDVSSEGPTLDLDPRLPSGLRDELVAHVQRFEAIRDPASFAAARRAAEALAVQLDASLRDGACGDSGVAEIRIPALQIGCGADGAHASLPVEPWRERAEQTPGDADDNLVALYSLAYGALSAEPSTAWTVQAGDGAGCSALGTGRVVEILRAADRTAAAAGEPFAEEIARVRAGALGEVGPEHARYCEPAESLAREVARILTDVRLSDAERGVVEGWTAK
jgi:hypothetical protein